MHQTPQTPERLPDAEQERIDWARLLGQRVAGLQGGLIATAESCTGGLIAASFTETAGSSAWFSRGYVTYANQAKIDMLGVDAATLAAGGAVSEAVAIQMAHGALRGADVLLSMAVTGIAGPDGGTPDKPVGTVCFGWGLRWPAGTDEPLLLETRHFTGDRRAVREQTVLYALQRALQLLDQYTAEHPVLA